MLFKNILNFIKKNERMVYTFICTILIFTIVLLIIYKKYDKQDYNMDSIAINVESKEEKQTLEDEKTIRVDIKGAVSKPGVYELKEGSIVNDLVKASGGLLKNSNTKEINLSKKLKDEMVIIIYTNSEIEEFKNNKKEKECICDNDINEACITEVYSNSYSYNSTLSNNYSSNSESNINVDNRIININTASIDELLSLPGIGESKAEAIIEYRKENKFDQIEDVMKVSGIGESLFNKIKENITV